MHCLRTPDDRFAGLPDWPWTPRYLDDLPGYEGIRLARVDEPGLSGASDSAPAGSATGGERPTALLLHGNPTWGYVYRHMIPVFRAAGLRVVVPDLIGFGRSDKPSDPSVHRFGWHRDLLLALIERLDLRDVLLVVQDWGGLLGLTLPMAMPERFTRLLAMNTMLATGEHLTEGFLAWRDYCNRTPDMAIGRMLARGKPSMPPAEQIGYDAPFPDAAHKVAVAAFANAVPASTTAEGAAISAEAARFWRDRWAGDSFLAVGLQDPVLGEPVMRRLAATIRDCPAPLTVPEAGHFVQEWGGPVARAALAAFGLSPPDEVGARSRRP